MTEKQWEIFCNFKKEFKEKVSFWTEKYGNSLEILQKQAADLKKTPEYKIETPVVYNKQLDEITQDSDIKLIVIGDNPGKNEQLSINNKYLVGQAGKLGEGFFKKNPELEIDFRKNVIILNKTPIHSAKTDQLKLIIQMGGDEIKNLLEESQIWMAKKTAQLHQNLCLSASNTSQFVEIWLVGYSELRTKGIFEQYRKILKASYDNPEFCDFWNQVLVFQHFSMNRFASDLKDFKAEILQLQDENLIKSENIKNLLQKLGEKHRKEIIGDL